MEPTSPGTDETFPIPGTDGASVPWTPSDIVDAAAATAPCALAPFVVQAGSTLWMVEPGAEGWTLAELQFHPRYGFFQERRRATYAWPREAFGAMLSHLVAYDVPTDTVSGLAVEFVAWLGTRIPAHVNGCSVTC